MLPEEVEKLAQQLREPKGKEGIAIGESIYQTNLSMIRHAIYHLNIQPKDSILEIKHGNGRHISKMMNTTTSLQYTGIEISSIMHQQSMANNEEWVNNKQVELLLYDGKTIPFQAATFNKVFADNTLYFWEDSLAFLGEIYRVLKKHGRLCLTYGRKEYLEKMPFSKYGFQLYSGEEINKLIDLSNFNRVSDYTINEIAPNKTNTGTVNRSFVTTVLEKT